MIGVINYNMGNLFNVMNAFDKLGSKVKLIGTPEEFDGIDQLVLPGVGAFDSLMKFIKENQLDTPLREWILADKPFLGICLGYQVLFESSEESTSLPGLGILKGDVRRFRLGKVPQIGWNTVVPRSENYFEEGYYYFVHSYFPEPIENEIIFTTTTYYEKFASAVKQNNLLATQFHPERSGQLGLRLLKRWMAC
ncbi:MAG: imidazole glycerol phosphate synthase subunit HisH [Candidatus Heimdallarchaeota archaeon]|nr:imidazole glycerol phosphate synthase subunit HisH [Candidatus Heimdallarchaeota archaeon]